MRSGSRASGGGASSLLASRMISEWQPRQRGGASLGNATLPAGDSRRFAKAVEEPINGHNRLLDGALPAAGLKPVVSLAAGFASQQNLTLLRELGYSYLINLTRGSRQNYAAEFCRQRLRAAT